MQTTGTNASPRQGFTLIELLVVIAIIAVLASLTVSAAMAIRGSGPRVQAQSELANFDGAISQFKQDFNAVTNFPSVIVLKEDFYDTSNAEHRKAYGFLSMMFGKNIFQQGGGANIVRCGGTGAGIDWNGNGTIDTAEFRLAGEQCLVFFLGGIPATSGGTNRVTGFSKNPENPAAGGGARSGPYFQFKSGRLASAGGGFFVYRDPYPRSDGTFANYAYFAANKGGTYEANSNVANFYRDGSGNPFRPNGYQIICAGPDGLFGSTPSSPGSVGGSGPSNPLGDDDQSNFARGFLKAGVN